MKAGKTFALRIAASCMLIAPGLHVPAQNAVAPPPPKPFVFPAYQRVVLRNGLTLLLLEKHDTPLISVNLTLRSGSTSDPAGKEGTANITAGLLRRGTAAHPADEIAEALDEKGMRFGASAGLDSTTVFADFLKKDTATALPLMAEVVLHPSFPEGEVAKALKRAQDEVRATKDNPQAALQIFFRKFLYGENLYGRPSNGDEGSTRSIQRQDLLAYYKTNYTPANAILAIAGDFEAGSMRAAVEKSFGAWSGAAPQKPEIAPLPAIHGRRVLLVDKPDATQTYFMVGNIGISATNPDRGRIEVVNTLFGGRFTSLFNTELRIKSGYSYGASSRFVEAREPGAFLMSTYTRNATTGPALDKTLEVLHTAHAQGFTGEQLQSSKATIAGSLPPQMETSQALANTMARNELYGITRDQFNANLLTMQNTSVADEKHVLSTYFPAEADLVIVVLGKAAEIGPLMNKYAADVQHRAISDPGF